MTPFKLISSIIVVTLILGYFIYPDPKLEPADPTQLPWHIVIDDKQNSSVFNLQLNQSTLQDAFNEFGEADSMALYADTNNPSIEVYFGYVEKAGLTARIIATLELTPSETDQFLSNAQSRMQSNSEIPKIEINASDRHKTLEMILSSITYIPKYTGLDQTYLIDRFGKPSHLLKLSDSAHQLFYKTRGLSVISDSEGKEVFQYTQPSLLIIPTQAKPYE